MSKEAATSDVPPRELLLEEIRELRERLQEADETLDAIRQGEVDALVVSEKQGEKVYTLASADRLYRLMIEEMGQGAVTLTPEGTILFCNRHFASIVGLPLESVLGASMHGFVAPESREPFADLTARSGAQGNAQGEVQLRATNGRLVPAYLASTTLLQEEGTPLCLVVTDLTEQQAAAAAAAANLAKDQFLASLSHELRTPLTPVLAGVCRMERDERLPSDSRRQLQMMRRNLELEARLIDDLLDLTRIERGKLELRSDVADLRQILEHALETTGQDLLRKRLRLITEFSTRDSRLWADTPRLTQVFCNLIHNAVKFTPEDGTIFLRMREDGEEGADGLVVEVEDTGLGIEPGSLEHIFDAFEQGAPGTARRFGGLGLGLAISKAIVELHGGGLSAYSEGRDQGALFEVRLPRGEVGSLRAVEPRRAAANEAEGDRSLRLLLVEDHADTAEAMADLLRDFGFQVTVAGSVTAALAAAEGAQGGIDLVVSDLGLPDGSGLDLMRTLSSRYGLRGIALSGYGMEEDIRHSREAGFERHLTKPVSPQTLVEALREAYQPKQTV
jgi:PAS domain S-box-containing protein